MFEEWQNNTVHHGLKPEMFDNWAYTNLHQHLLKSFMANAENTLSLYRWLPVWLRIRLLCLSLIHNTFTRLAKSKPVKQEVSHTVILPLTKCSEANVLHTIPSCEWTFKNAKSASVVIGLSCPNSFAKHFYLWAQIAFSFEPSWHYLARLQSIRPNNLLPK